jgi:dUTP pyrophosphatase
VLFLAKLSIKFFVSDEKLSPVYSSAEAAAMDLKSSGVFLTNLDFVQQEVSSDEFILGAGERVGAKTGLHIELPKGYWGSIRGRGGLSLKQGIDTLGGVLDSDFRGEVVVILVNTSKKPVTISKYERIAQMVVMKHESPKLILSKKLSETERGHKGFGSSGKH